MSGSSRDSITLATVRTAPTARIDVRRATSVSSSGGAKKKMSHRSLVREMTLPAKEPEAYRSILRRGNSAAVAMSHPICSGRLQGLLGNPSEPLMVRQAHHERNLRTAHP